MLSLIKQEGDSYIDRMAICRLTPKSVMPMQFLSKMCADKIPLFETIRFRQLGSELNTTIIVIPEVH